MIAQRHPVPTHRSLVREALDAADPERTAPVNLLLAASAALLLTAVILGMTSGFEQLLALTPLVAVLCFVLWWMGNAVREERARSRRRDNRLLLAHEMAVAVLLEDSSEPTKRLAAELIIGGPDRERLQDLGEMLLRTKDFNGT